MNQPWIRGCVVQRIMFRGGLVLNLDDNELVIAVPFHLTLPATDRDDEEAVLIDPKPARAEERALFDFAVDVHPRELGRGRQPASRVLGRP